MPIVRPETLTADIATCFRAQGLAPSAAQLVAESLVQADLWGHPSHGALRTFWYGDRLDSGAINPQPRLECATEPTALSALDGDAGMGQVVAQAAMDQAIRAAKRHGLGAVAVRNSGHFGMAMSFTIQAAARGCIGFLSTNASPAMAPWGGRDKRLGTNPFSWAAPAGRYPPFVLDIATTAVARGKLYAAQAAGQSIPPGWAIDQDGQATCDPQVGIAGTILPMAGHKGYALSMTMDILSGILSGSAFGKSIIGPYTPEGRSGAGHFVLAVDIEQIRPLAEFEADMEALILDLKSSPKAPGVTEILVPGEPEARAEVLHRRDGLALPDATWAALQAGARARGIRDVFRDPG